MKGIEQLIKERESKLMIVDSFLVDSFDLELLQRELLAPTILDLIIDCRVPLWARVLKRFYLIRWWLFGVTVFTLFAFAVSFFTIQYQRTKYPFIVETSKNDRFNGVSNSSPCMANLCVPERLKESVNETLNEIRIGEIVAVTVDNEIWQIERTDKRFVIVVSRR